MAIVVCRAARLIAEPDTMSMPAAGGKRRFPAGTPALATPAYRYKDRTITLRLRHSQIIKSTT
jgi:hypothetical protein